MKFVDSRSLVVAPLVALLAIVLRYASAVQPMSWMLDAVFWLLLAIVLFGFLLWLLTGLRDWLRSEDLQWLEHKSRFVSRICVLAALLALATALDMTWVVVFQEPQHRSLAVVRTLCTRISRTTIKGSAPRPNVGGYWCFRPHNRTAGSTEGLQWKAKPRQIDFRGAVGAHGVLDLETYSSSLLAMPMYEIVRNIH